MDQKNRIDLSVVILTGNEAIHIRRCLEGLQVLAPQAVFVVDCLSNDKTAEIARSMGATVVERAWPGAQSAQFNWALENLPIKTEWVLRLDADEYLTEELVDEIKACVPSLPARVTGLVFPRYNLFFGKRMRRGTGTVKLLRMFRRGKARSEARLMDEHICLLEGESLELKGFLVDHNLNGIGAWTEKHNNYSLREAVELLDVKYGILHENREKNGSSHIGCIGAQAAMKRANKLKYANLPLFWRSAFYFAYRYFFRLGFTEGVEGFVWHFLQGLWYRMLVDAKIWEIERLAGVRDSQAPALALQGVLLEHYGVDCHAKNPFARSLSQAAGQRSAATKRVAASDV